MPSESVDSLKRGGIWFLPAGSRFQVEIVGDVNVPWSTAFSATIHTSPRQVRPPVKDVSLKKVNDAAAGGQWRRFELF